MLPHGGFFFFRRNCSIKTIDTAVKVQNKNEAVGMQSDMMKKYKEKDEWQQQTRRNNVET